MIEVQWIAGPITAAMVNPVQASGRAGAWVVFSGAVRALENSSTIAALDYEVYEPMSSQCLQALAEAILQRFDLQALVVWHSVGKVPVSEASFKLGIASAHRKEALQAMESFIDRMKQEVPIWKNPVESCTGA